jgi:hypothetical protein
MVLLLPQIAKSITQQAGREPEDPQGGFPLGETNFPTPPSFIQNPPEWLLIVFNVSFLLLIFGIIYFVWRRYRPRSDTQAVVVTQVKQALSDLDAGLELKDVVIDCYSKMCRGFQKDHQITRKKAMTPREFEAHLAIAGFDNVHIHQLTRLFEGVRYGANAPDKTQEIEARQCLQSILQVYDE